ncbi:MAG: 2-succinyl-5-enolpyruvyl-6-hydroxy-3-cyclohexene-1-carboxylic-acid synthase [Bacteroidota bacterium]
MHTLSARLDAAPHLNQVWAELIVEELVRLGVGLFCVAPGSRSTPLTLAVAAHPEAKALVHFDERGSAFAALGYARAAQSQERPTPAVWITTSGTALANGMPAVVEASVDGVPLLLLTADRPPELRQTGANQTITQPGLFDPYVRWAFDLPTPSTEMPAAAVLTTVDQAWHRAGRAPGGPVHLNAMFREPLAPPPKGAADFPEGSTDWGAYLRPLAHWTNGETPFTQYAAPLVAAPPGALTSLRATLQRAERGVVVVGRLRTEAESSAARRVAEALGWPLLADVESGLRTGHADHPLVVAHADLVLTSAPFCAAVRPDAVLHLGGRPVSKRLAQHLAACAPPCYAVVRDGPDRFDPRHHVTHRFESDLVAFADALLAGDVVNPTDDAWQAGWHKADTAVRKHLADTLDAVDQHEPLSEPLVARLVSQHRPADHALVLAASMPIRDVDAFADPTVPAAEVFANRGASGIDGTVATAAGVARGRSAPATLLIGDLALLHDLNSLALLRDPDVSMAAQPPVVIVAINNDGGGIFHFLPLAREGVESGAVPAANFERFFGTPHGLGFADAARLFNLAYHAPTTPAGFIEAYRTACTAATSSLIEVRTERDANRALHAHLLETAAGAVTAVCA